MKLKSLTIIAATAVIASSCSLVSPKGTTVKGSEGQQSTPPSASQTHKPAKGEPTKESDKAESVKYETPKSSSQSNQKAQDKQSAQPDARLNGEWVIIAVGNKEIPLLDDMPYINFENNTGRFYMSNTCNILNGDFKSVADSKLYFDNTLSTMKYCADAEYEAAITAAIAAVPLSYKIEDLGHETYITFSDSKGNTLMKARKHNMEFLNGNWRIAQVGDKAINDEEANVFIDIAEQKIHGNTGCNFFNGQIYINPEKTNAIDFSNMASTRMACPKMDQESAIFLALEETVTAIKGNNDEAMLLNDKGQVLMVLKRISNDEQ